MRLAAPLLAAAAVWHGAPAPAAAAEFFLYLECSGEVSAEGARPREATLSLALRDNNETALIQASNVLPVGERLRYKASPQRYSMRYLLSPLRGAYYDWWYGGLFAWYPSLSRITAIRLSIDRQTGELTGIMENVDDEALGRLQMQCEPVDEADLPPPKF